MNQDTNRPHCFAKHSKKENLYPGTYLICRCGLSKDGVFCDGAHKDTAFSPKKIYIREPQSINICLCKHSVNFPYCDGSHRSI